MLHPTLGAVSGGVIAIAMYLCAVTCDEGNDAPVACRYTVLWFDGEHESVVATGPIQDVLFQSLFLDPFIIAGHSESVLESDKLCGVLLARRDDTVISIPIWMRSDDSYDFKYICLARKAIASDAPCASATAKDRPELLDIIKRQMSGVPQVRK